MNSGGTLLISYPVILKINLLELRPLEAVVGSMTAEGWCVSFVSRDVTMEWTETHIILRTVEWLGIFPSLKQKSVTRVPSDHQAVCQPSVPREKKVSPGLSLRTSLDGTVINPK